MGRSDTTTTTTRGRVHVDTILEHYGVLGMKWGVRKDDRSPVEVSVKAKPGKKVSATGGSGHSPTPDATKAAASRQLAKKSSTDALTNKELQDLVQRMNLEQQYTRLTTQKRQKGAGAKFVEGLVTNMAKQHVTTIANEYSSQIGDALKHKKK